MKAAELLIVLTFTIGGGAWGLLLNSIAFVPGTPLFGACAGFVASLWVVYRIRRIK